MNGRARVEDVMNVVHVHVIAYRRLIVSVLWCGRASIITQKPWSHLWHTLVLINNSSLSIPAHKNSWPHVARMCRYFLQRNDVHVMSWLYDPLMYRAVKNQLYFKFSFNQVVFWTSFCSWKLKTGKLNMSMLNLKINDDGPLTNLCYNQISALYGYCGLNTPTATPKQNISPNLSSWFLCESV